MKKIKKNEFRLDKEIISSLSENDLSGILGGENTVVPENSNKCNTRVGEDFCNISAGQKKTCPCIVSNVCYTKINIDCSFTILTEAENCQPLSENGHSCIAP